MVKTHAWTERDQSILRELYARGKDVKYIADVIGSTPSCVRRYASQFKVYRNDSTCRYCEKDLVHPSRGRHKTYCDALCQSTHYSEIETSASLSRHQEKGLLCQHCGTPVPPFRRKWCSVTCGKAGWHRAVWDDPKRRARRMEQLRKARKSHGTH